jgi:hypothetical protein
MAAYVAYWRERAEELKSNAGLTTAARWRIRVAVS